jgi:GNAT superfamily N-acetyltransferase
MTLEIAIREATNEDLAVLVPLYAALDLVGERALSVERAREILGRIRSYPHYRVFVATMAGRIVGAFSLLVMDTFAHTGATAGIVEDVVVDGPWRRKGIGKQMMYFAMDYCREIGCHKMVLSSNMKREGAHRFYESLGFEKYGYSFAVSLQQQP